MRRTVEGDIVTHDCAVYEIIYQYYNAEVSLAVPHLTSEGNVPKEFKVFKGLEACRRACVMINNKNGFENV